MRDDHDFIIVAVQPVFPRFERPNQRMRGFVIMFGSMTVLRFVAATHASAAQARTQMHPRVAQLHTTIASARPWGDRRDELEMGARLVARNHRRISGEMGVVHGVHASSDLSIRGAPGIEVA